MNTFYMDAVTPARGVDGWNANQLDKCGNTTFSASGTLTFSKLAGIEAEGTEITLGVAVAKHVVIFTGGTSDEAEFVQHRRRRQ